MDIYVFIAPFIGQGIISCIASGSHDLGLLIVPVDKKMWIHEFGEAFDKLAGKG